MNQLADRRCLWRDISKLNTQQQQHEPWCLIGDFNNVLQAKDRIGGRDVTEAEYIDFKGMMERVGLFEMDSCGEYFTWSNKQTDNTICSRIDRCICNLSWHQLHADSTLMVMPPSVSDHAMLYLKCI